MFDFTISMSSEPILTFGILLLIILIVPLLFQQIKLPGIVGLIFAGIIIGPGGLGVIEAKGVIDVFGKVGLLFLMFLAGLEINMEEFKKESKGTMLFGAITFLIPQLAGTFIFTSLGYDLKSSILIASMFASHTLVAYPIIVRLGLSKEKSVVTAVGGTIITDIAALLVLAVIARSVEGNLDVYFWLKLTGLFSLYVAGIFFVLPAISYRFFKMVGERGRYTFVYVFGSMMIVAWLAELIGVEAIVGAFLAGLAFNRLLTNKGQLRNRIDFFGDAFFIPFFLIYVGMQVDVSVVMSDLNVWIVMIAMTLTVLGTKFLASFISGKILKFSWDQIWVLFGLSQTQAAATLAAAFVGVEIGLLGDEILNGSIFMILITCIIGPIIIERTGYKLSDPITLESNSETKEIKHSRILIPLSNPKTTARLIECASNFGSNKSAILYPLSVVNTIVRSQDQQDVAQKLLDLATGQIYATGSSAKPLVENNINIAEGIHLAANRNAITDIIMGWNGTITTTSRVFGTILDQVLQTSDQRVYVCKLDQPISTFKRLTLALPPKISFGKTFFELFDTLMNFAENLNTPVVIYYIEREEQQIQMLKNLSDASVSCSFRGIGSSDLFIPTLIDELKSDDLLILTNDRSSDYGWFYGTNMIPRTLNQKKPDNSFIVAYPFLNDIETQLTEMIYKN
jgi:Kef-type K+ transport system membrane component KefB